MAANWILAVILDFWFLSFGVCHGLRVTELLVPNTTDLRQDFNINCSYHLENEQLQSLKLYVSGSEVFRFLPSLATNTLKFNSTKGVRAVSGECSHEQCSVWVRAPFGNHSVRCEASSERPFFYIEEKTAFVNVIAEPYYDPVILGVPDHISAGDFVKLNCTTDLSLPAARIEWYINDKPANATYTSAHYYIEPDEQGLRKSSRSLLLYIRRAITAVRCESSVHGMAGTRDATVLLKVEEPHISMYIASGNHHTKGFMATHLILFIYVIFILLN